MGGGKGKKKSREREQVVTGRLVLMMGIKRNEGKRMGWGSTTKGEGVSGSKCESKLDAPRDIVRQIINGGTFHKIMQ